MNTPTIFFCLFAGLAVACSLLVILKKNPVSSAFSLVLVFFAFAGMYAVMEAHLIAALQVLVYAGAIMVLFIFVIMLLNADEPSFDLGRTHGGLKAGAIFFSAILFGLCVWAFKESPQTLPQGPYTPEAIEAAGGNTRVVSELLFSEYILPFELTSVLLLAAIVGAVAIAKRKLTGHQTTKMGVPIK